MLGSAINYDPWGQPLANPVSTDNAPVTNNFSSFATAGKVTDPGSGITIMGARAYMAAEGRFTSVDPEQGGCANGYVYAFGDPFTQSDLTGRASCGTVLAGAALDAGAITLGILAIPETGGTSLLLLAGGTVLATGSAIISEPGCHRDHDQSACVSMWVGYAGMASGTVTFLPESALAKLGLANLAAGSYVAYHDYTASQPSVGSCLMSGVSNAWNGVSNAASGAWNGFTSLFS